MGNETWLNSKEAKLLHCILPTLHVHCTYTARTLHIHCTYTACTLHIHVGALQFNLVFTENPFTAHSFIMMIHVIFLISYFGEILVLPLNNYLGIISILFEVFTHMQFNFPMEYKSFWDGS